MKIKVTKLPFKPSTVEELEYIVSHNADAVAWHLNKLASKCRANSILTKLGIAGLVAYIVKNEKWKRDVMNEKRKAEHTVYYGEDSSDE